MKRMFSLAIVGAALAIAAFAFQAQNRPPQPAAGADPYANNAAPRLRKFRSIYQ